MNVAVIGTGYVGLVQGVCLAELGNNVTCIDVDEEKINNLKSCISPIFEPGIEELLAKNIEAKRISFTSNLKSELDNVDIVFIAVGTPPDEDGRADLKYVLAAAKDIATNLSKPTIIVNKSTVPIGTGQLVKSEIEKYYDGEFSVISNPEFLREGSAINDWMKPDRVIIGHHSDIEAAEKVAKLYEVLKSPVLITSLETAELIKYASNSFLATQISFINSVAEICEKVGANIIDVSNGMKLDKRIGANAFLNAGLGYGGSCFPKDVEALIKISKDNDFNFKILEEVENVNYLQREKFIEKIVNKFDGNLDGLKFAVWGIAFKPNTDDIRMAPSLTIIKHLLDRGVQITAFDPVAKENATKIFPMLSFSNNSMEACRDADALIIITEWHEFKQTDFDTIKSIMKKPIIFDGRNIYNHEEMEEKGFHYHSIGRKDKNKAEIKSR